MKTFRNLAVLAAVAAMTKISALAPGQASPSGSGDEAPAYWEMVLGSEDTEIEVIEYASFTCSHCASFHKNAFEALKENYIDTGKISFEMREVYFDRVGLWAGITARCGGRSKYFAIVDILFDKQSEWANGLDAQAIATRLKAIGLAVGLKPETIDACFRDGPKAEMLVNTSKGFMDADGIKSTPSFVINGKKYSNMSYEKFSEILDEELSN